MTGLYAIKCQILIRKAVRRIKFVSTNSNIIVEEAMANSKEKERNKSKVGEKLEIPYLTLMA